MSQKELTHLTVGGYGVGKRQLQDHYKRLEELKQRQLLALKYEDLETGDDYALQIQRLEEELKSQFETQGGK